MDNTKYLKIRNDVLVSCDYKAVGEVVIPEGVTKICECAFKNCRYITSIKIPNTVRKIDQCAFYQCYELVSVNIPNTVSEISCCFEYCYKLKNVNIPNTAKTIAPFAFAHCSHLESIEIPDSVTMICGSAFQNCVSLKNIKIPKSVADIRLEVFYQCKNLKCNKINTNQKKILAYKGFNGNLSCKDFQYEIGKTYHEDDAKTCECGFHACINPIDILDFYPNKDGNRFALVELSGKIDFSEVRKTSKLAATDIKIIKELSFQDLIDEFNRLNS